MAKKTCKTSTCRAPDGSRNCRHCHSRLICRPRGFCRPCFKNLGIRNLYPGPQCRQDVGAAYGNADRQIEPTNCPPGSEGKIEVMRERAERLAPLHHPLDAGYQEKITLPSRRRRLEIVINAYERISAVGI